MQLSAIGLSPDRAPRQVRFHWSSQLSSSASKHTVRQVFLSAIFYILVSNDIDILGGGYFCGRYLYKG